MDDSIVHGNIESRSEIGRACVVVEQHRFALARNSQVCNI